jgi:hypothetical protein
MTEASQPDGNVGFRSAHGKSARLLIERDTRSMGPNQNHGLSDRDCIDHAATGTLRDKTDI